jgi:antitoxin Phd
MIKQYSIAHARNHFTAIVHDLKRTRAVKVTRRGKVVAVLMTIEEYERLTVTRTNFWTAYETFRKSVDLSQLNIEPDIFAGVGDTSSGRVPI